MRNRLPAALLCCLLTAVIFVPGCSSGASSTSTDLLASEYTGSWSGNWQDHGQGWVGTLTFTAKSNGSISGSCTRIPWGTGDISGTMYSNGDISYTYRITYANTYTFSGNLNLAVSGHASGVLNEYDHGTKIGTAEVSLQK